MAAKKNYPTVDRTKKTKQGTSNWFTDAMSEANMGVVRGAQKKLRKK